jgi:hypothetical protein
MGVEASFSVDKDVRKHAGFSVHRWKTATSMTETADGNPLPAGFMEGWMNQELGLTTVGKLALMSSDPAKLDKMINPTIAGDKGSPLKLKAMAAFGQGRHVYFDYDIFAVMKSVFGGMSGDQPSGNPFGSFAKSMKEGDPVVLAGTFDTARALLQVRVPIGLFRQFGAIAKQATAPPPALIEPKEKNSTPDDGEK